MEQKYGEWTIHVKPFSPTITHQPQSPTPLPQPETEAPRQKMNLSEPAEEYRYVMIYIFKMRHYRWNLRVTTVSAKRIWAHEIK